MQLPAGTIEGLLEQFLNAEQMLILTESILD